MSIISQQSTELPAFIFDLDGVLVDTAHYHYLAWSRLAKELGFSFTEKDNEGLKGVSRMQALEVLLKIGGYSASPKEKEEMAARKNEWYTTYLETLNKDHLLPGAYDFIVSSREMGIKIALGSASKNARTILSKLELLPLFDVIVDGTMTTKAKPDPEVFLLGAQLLEVTASTCVVFEDAQAGIDAANAANMTAVGIGEEKNLRGAALVVPSLAHLKPEKLAARLKG
jgi:beta-phosphoglucomutase